MSTVIEEVIDMWDELDMHPTSEFEHALMNNGQGLGHSMSVIERISALARSLSDIKVTSLCCCFEGAAMCKVLTLFPTCCFLWAG